MEEVLNFGVEPITCHAWNSDRTRIAVSHNDHRVVIYRISGSQFELESTLDEHAQRVTGIDWGAKTNMIVTCSADRNAYVWKEAGGGWRPTLVILRINRAATCVRWSPHENKFAVGLGRAISQCATSSRRTIENKFAVGSGARLISVCYFEQENDWWVSKHIKKPIRSTITCLDWHPNNVLLAAGSTDFKARVYSTYIKEVDPKPEATNWGKKMTFANLMAEFSNGASAWVHDVSFSEDGENLAWVGHDSSVSVASAAQGMQMCTTRSLHLPYLTVLWVSPSMLITAGHDCCPMAYRYDGQSVSFVARIEENKAKSGGQKFSALKHFQSLATHNTTVDKNVTDIGTIHQNAIYQLSVARGTKAACSVYANNSNDQFIYMLYLDRSLNQLSVVRGTKAACSVYATGGADGKIVLRKTTNLESAMRDMRI